MSYAGDITPEQAWKLLSENPEAVLELFPAIIKAEMDGDAGYQRWADGEPDPEVARLLRLNGREETKHGERAARALAILEAAQA